METFVSAPEVRSPSPSYELDGEMRADPELGFSWSGEEPAADDYSEPAQLFLVANQTGTSPRGEPLFGSPVRSSDDNLAMSEDGYLINGQGQFVLGLPLDGDSRPAGRRPEILRIRADAAPPSATDWVVYRANLPCFPFTANADFEKADSELLDRTQLARDPSAQGSGIVLGDDRVKFLACSLAGGSVAVFTRDGTKVPLVLRWAKVGSLRSAGCDSWNLFYRARRDPRGGEVAWKNSGHTLAFEADGRLTTSANSIPIFDVTVDGIRLGNLSLIFGAGGITQFADRTGLVKVLELTVNGSAGGTFTGISMSSRGRLFAHYTDGLTRPLADVHLPEDENWGDSSSASGGAEFSRRVA
jgi:flagellar hook protein FlgE